MPENALRSGSAGFTLIEVLFAATILVIGVLGLLTVLDAANAGTSKVRAVEGATTLARQVTEAARSVPYGGLTPQTIEARLAAEPGLADQSPGLDWTIERRGFSYVVSATECSVDDPADGMGSHASGIFCADSGAAGTADRNPDDYKRVRIEVSWSSGSGVRRVHQVALISNPGSAGGPSVTDVKLTSPLASPITSSVAEAGLSATTSSPAASVTWSVDGVAQATATGSATSWSFTWPVASLVDGTHLVTAQAFDQAGLSGAMRSATITLNRFVATAPTGFAGGRNGTVVDFEWLPNPELDIVGYRVFRDVAPGSPVLVCSLTRATTCQDTNPPAGTLSYYVVADDLDAGGQHRDGIASEPIDVTTLNQAPNPPPQLSAAHGDGVTTLTWTAPSPADPDGGDVAFYRIYRDGTAFADRYDRTGTGTELSYIDSRTDDTQHQYWVVAVDGQLAESTRVGPVTG